MSTIHDAGTTVGNLGSARSAIVDRGGLVHPDHGDFAVDWSVGAEDRWHDPSASANVRQELVGDTPVVETRMRVPGGDVVHRSYAMVATAADGGGDLVIVELENDSAVPVAVSFGVRAAAGAAITVDSTSVRVDGGGALLLPREPNEVSEENGRTTVTFPLPHSATIQVAVPIESQAPRRAGLFRKPKPASLQSFPAAVPTADQVVGGWRSQTDRGLRLVLPDERLQSAIDANRRFLLLLHRSADVDFRAAAHRLAALDRFGFHREVGEVFLPFATDQAKDGALFAKDAEGNAAALWALAHHWDLTRNVELVEHLATSIAGAAELVARRGGGDPWSLAGLRGAPRLLRAAGEEDAAVQATKLASASTLDDGVPIGENPFVEADEMLATASTTWTWAAERPHDPAAVARFCSLVRASVAREVDGGVALLSTVPRRWFGQGIEVHDAPTRHGILSFGVRWHGERPALLWELEPHDPDSHVTITCPGIDPTWTTDEARGETLLEAPADLPESTPDDVPVVPGPEQGDSFG